MVCRNPGLRRTHLYLEALLRRIPLTDSRIYLGHRAAIDVKNYQLSRAAQAFGNLRPLILYFSNVDSLSFYLEQFVTMVGLNKFAL